MQSHKQKSQSQQNGEVEVVAGSAGAAVTQSNGPEQVPQVAADLSTAQQAQDSTKQEAEAVNAEQKPVANFETFLEQLAHGMAYDADLDENEVKFLEVNGYRPGAVIRGKREFVMRSFIPLQAGKPPVVAFRGTVPTKVPTLIADLDPGSIGDYQFKANIEEIKAVMTAASAHGALVATGHSLGGALAQIAAATFPELVGSIVTFQAPGVSNSTVAKVEEYNEANPEKAISSSHHRVEGDLVPLGGQALTPGEVHNHTMQGGNPLSKHLAYPLAQESRAAGEAALPYQGDQANISHSGDVSTEVANADKTQLVEWARKGVGVLVYTGMEVGNATVEAGKTVIGLLTSTGRFIGRLFSGGDQEKEDEQQSN
ncbi:MAG: hypothetical protein R3B48_16615 [Kofleriaceae bacterium]